MPVEPAAPLGGGLSGAVALLLVLPALLLFAGAVASGFALLRHRAGGSLAAWAVNGMWFFQARRFTPAGQPHLRRFRRFFAGFLLYVVAAAALGIVWSR